MGLRMNDFTKQELQIIHLDMIRALHETPILNPSPSHVALIHKVESMIDNYRDPKLDYGHLTDKHIGQWAGYLIEEYPRWRELENLLINNPEIEELFLKMYKKGYHDCKTAGGTRSE